MSTTSQTQTISTSLHEVAHGVAAIEMSMLGIDLKLGKDISRRAVKTEGSTGYRCPILAGESELDMLQRHLIVILAGIAWEEFATVNTTLAKILKSQRDDKLAAIGVVRLARKRCRIVRGELRKWVSESWETAKGIVDKHKQSIGSVAVMLDDRKTISDTTLRFAIALSDLETADDNLGDVGATPSS